MPVCFLTRDRIRVDPHGKGGREELRRAEEGKLGTLSPPQGKGGPSCDWMHTQIGGVQGVS